MKVNGESAAIGYIREGGPGPLTDKAQDEGGIVTNQTPLVAYLVLEPGPHLVAQECVACSARFLDRRNGCARCFKTSFRRVPVATSGHLLTYTIVAVAGPGIQVPFIAGVFDCGGTIVRGNLINVEPDPEAVDLGMKVRLATFVVGTDDDGTEAIGFGFSPVEVRQ